MKIIVFSDSHRDLDGMRQVIDREKPNYVFHLGDHDSDAEQISQAYPALPVAMVRGNCDGWSDTPTTLSFILGSLRFFLCHGHTYGVKNHLLQAVYAAEEARADFLLFGHTHEALLDEEDGIQILNPGACGYGPRPTCAVITIGPGKVCSARIRTIEN